MPADSTTLKEIFSIGHSNQSLEKFLGLLREHKIDVVVDVRSYPFSKYAKHFDMDSMKKAVPAAGFQYMYFGKELGGMPKDDQYYDAEKHVLYDKLAASEPFQQGLTRLLNGVQKYTIALMCGEENPEGCHRRLLIARVLADHEIKVQHIRGDGRVQTENDFVPQPQSEPLAQQLSLFTDTNG